MMGNLLIATERAREAMNSATSRKSRAEIGQFLTPAPIAQFMASMFEKQVERVRILDPGAGVGALFAALVQTLCNRPKKPVSIEVVAYENDNRALPLLGETMAFCMNYCAQVGIDFVGDIRNEDFISSALHQTEETLLVSGGSEFTHAILNPPYKKINKRSKTAKRLDAVGIEASNLYAIFVWLSMQMLKSGGELAGITPRSFCNGPYFRKFRKKFLATTSLRRIHAFESRKKAFCEDAVLQENVIFYAVRNARKPQTVLISSTYGADFSRVRTKSVPYESIVRPDDRDEFIHLLQNENDIINMERMNRLTATLQDLELEVSTGRVVDFRVRDFLLDTPAKNTVPLIYPCHLQKGSVRWPKTDTKKPNALIDCRKTFDLTIPSGYYVLTKRFSSKEEPRRIVASVLTPEDLNSAPVGLENHLNYFHAGGKGLPGNVAKGLALFLNSSFCDACFRIFSGHTQVNATDLRKIRYPSYDVILRLGAHVKKHMPPQEDIDRLVEKELGFDA